MFRDFYFPHPPSPNSYAMRKFLLLLAACPTLLSAQTIIELKPGGTVRSKTIDDYKQEQHMTERLRQDSLKYVDNLRRAFNDLRADSTDRAERLFNENLKLRPDAPGNYIIRHYLALIQMQRGKYQQAAQQLDELVKNFPDYHDARIARAECNLQLNKANEAIRDADVLLPANNLQLIPADITQRARFVKASAHYRLRLYNEANTELLILLKDDPTNVGAQVLRSLCLQQMGQPKEALNQLNFIVEANPDNTDALTARANIETELQMYAPARDDYNRIIALLPNDANAYIERARVLISQGEKTAARRDLDKAVALGTPMGVVQALYMLTR